MATAVSGCWPRAVRAGSLGRASSQALIGQSPLPILVANVADGDCGFWLLAPSSFGGLFRSGKFSGADWPVPATDPGRERGRWRLRFLVVGPERLRAGSLGQASSQALIGQSPLPILVANVADGDCGFWLLAPSGFGRGL